jgi:hypothetical protein
MNSLKIVLFSALSTIFLLQISQSSSNLQNTKISQLCPENSTLCADPPGYPTERVEQIQRILRRKRSVRNIFEDNTVATEDISAEDVKLCQTHTYRVQPRAAKNRDGKFVFVVNGMKEVGDFVQLVEVTECVEAGTQCGMGEVVGRQRTRCKQSYREHRMLAMSGGMRLVRDTFIVPSGCYCQLVI